MTKKLLTSKTNSIVVVLSFLLLITACGSIETQQINPPQTLEEQVSTLAAATQICDCFLNFEVQVWKDENRNGTFDKDELPIEGLELRLIVNNTTDLAVTKSNSQGYAKFNYATNDCKCFGWTSKIVFDVPSGYELVSEKWVEAQNYTGRLYEVALAQTQNESLPTP